MSKHIEIKVRDDNKKVTITTFSRDSNWRKRDVRQFTVSLFEFERALRNATIEVPWKGLL